MVITIHLYDDSTKPPGHFLSGAASCCPTKEPGNTSVKVRGDPHLPSLAPEKELAHALSVISVQTTSERMQLKWRKSSIVDGWMFPEHIIPALRSGLCLCCQGTWNNSSLLQVHNRKQFRTSPSLRRLILHWTPHSGHSSFPVSINKADSPPAGITASQQEK